MKGGRLTTQKKPLRADNARIYQYFRDKCQGINLSTARQRIQQRFPDVTTAKWHRLKPALEKMVPGAGQPLTGPPNETTCQPQGYEPQVTIPDNTTPEAKAAISQLVAVNCQQECRIQTLQVENSSLRDGVGRSESRVRVLKSLLRVVLAAM